MNKKLVESCKDLIVAVNLARQEQHIRSMGDGLRADAYDQDADQLAVKISDIIETARATISEAEALCT